MLVLQESKGIRLTKQRLAEMQRQQEVKNTSSPRSEFLENVNFDTFPYTGASETQSLASGYSSRESSPRSNRSFATACVPGRRHRTPNPVHRSRSGPGRRRSPAGAIGRTEEGTRHPTPLTKVEDIQSEEQLQYVEADIAALKQKLNELDRRSPARNALRRKITALEKVAAEAAKQGLESVAEES